MYLSMLRLTNRKRISPQKNPPTRCSPPVLHHGKTLPHDLKQIISVEDSFVPPRQQSAEGQCRATTQHACAAGSAVMSSAKRGDGGGILFDEARDGGVLMRCCSTEDGWPGETVPTKAVQLAPIPGKKRFNRQLYEHNPSPCLELQLCLHSLPGQDL